MKDGPDVSAEVFWTNSCDAQLVIGAGSFCRRKSKQKKFDEAGVSVVADVSRGWGQAGKGGDR